MNSPPNVPYQAYKSKRHTRDLSSQSGSNGVPSQSRPQPIVGTLGNGRAESERTSHQRTGSLSAAESHLRPGRLPNEAVAPRPASMIASLSHHERPESIHFDYAPYAPHSTSPPLSSPSSSSEKQAAPPSPLSPIPAPATETHSFKLNGNGSLPTSPMPGPSSLPVAGSSGEVVSSPRRTSTFRRMPLRPANTRSALPSSPLRPLDTHARTPSNGSTLSRQLDPPRVTPTPSQGSSNASSPPVAPYDRALPTIPSIDLPARPSTAQQEILVHAATSPSSPVSGAPPPRAASLRSSPEPRHRALSPGPTPALASHSHSASSSAIVRSAAPYRPGFQPKGVYRPRTDEFIEARKLHHDEGRIERTRLERRLEKLIHLHFTPEEQKSKEKATQASERPSRPNKRLSSIFDMNFSELRSKSASDLWKDVVQTQVTPGNKNDIRAAEQTITPWEDDASVTQCPLCSASFHPLTNRKHHCRLCGRIICSLPIKYPQRPQTCSILFVADPKTGRIEEVGEGVDYGVRRRTTSTNAQAKARVNDNVLSEEEKFLKGVRICRECRPVLLRQQYKQEVHSVPVFFKLYDAFVSLEKDIEDALPQFQELMLSLSKQERPTPEASAARKRLLEAFSQYDVLAKRIRQLPCPGGPGSSQDRIQAAILTRANAFLQKHMFPLQSLPKPKLKTEQSTAVPTEVSEQAIDPDSEVARVLQPLLEQEALLESFVEEAKAHRKFEDAKTLKANLQEIRAEINRILANAEAGMGGSRTKINGRPPNNLST